MVYIYIHTELCAAIGGVLHTLLHSSYGMHMIDTPANSLNRLTTWT